MPCQRALYRSKASKPLQGDCATGASGLPRRFLVVGSSVSTGAGASKGDLLGWAALLASAAKKQGIAYANWGVGGTHVTFWQDVVSNHVQAKDLAPFGAVFLS